MRCVSSVSPPMAAEVTIIEIDSPYVTGFLAGAILAPHDFYNVGGWQFLDDSREILARVLDKALWLCHLLHSVDRLIFRDIRFHPTHSLHTSFIFNALAAMRFCSRVQPYSYAMTASSVELIW